MIITEINLAKIKKLDLIELLSKKKIKQPTNNEFKRILKGLVICVEIGKFNQSLNIIILGLFINSSITIDFIKQKGIFRYSKYKGKKCIIANLIEEIICFDNKLFTLSKKELDYLQSIQNFSSSYNIYSVVDKFILNEIKRFEIYHKKESIIKTFLAFGDFLFLSNHYVNSKTDLLSLESRSKEDISMAISYLIHFISERRPKNLKDTNKSSTSYINSSEFQKMIGFVCMSQDLKEIEVLIDNFNYTCLKSENNLELIAPSENFQKSIKLGYIKSDIQILNNYLKNNDSIYEGILSLEDLVEELYTIEKIEIFEYTETFDSPRYRLVLPEPVFDFFVEKYFAKNLLFKDEVLYLSQINNEQLLDTDKLESIIIKENLTLFDIIKFRRFFSFFYKLFTNKIFKNENVMTDVLIRSLIPTFKEDILYNYLERFSTKSKVDSFLDTIYWEPNLDIIFDLQYQPILFIDKYFLIPLSIFHQSNFIRNLYASEYKKNNTNLLSNGVIDVLVNELANTFSKSSIENYSQTPIPKSDIDLFAIFDNTLYIFECKHTLHPVNSFDLRTTYNYIKKAEKQLNHIVNLYNQGKLIKLLEKKWNLNLSNIDRVQCCIVLSNRLFNGNVFKYPVRYISEIKNAVNSGIMETEKGKFKLWDGENLSNSDLLEYFSLESKLVKLLFDSLSEETLVYDLMTPPLKIKNYYLDIKYAVKKLDEFTSNLKPIK
jgi:hypothetical protein